MPKSNVSTGPISTSAPLWARISLLSGVGFVALLALLHLIEPGFDPSWRFISEYALGRHGWVMSLAFASLAVSATALLLAIANQVRTVGGYVGIGLLTLSIVGFILAAAFPTDPIDATDPTTSGTVHSVAAALGGNVAGAAYFLSWSLARNRAWRDERRVLGLALVIAVISTVASLVMQAVIAASGGTFGPETHVGWPNRILIVALAGWLIAAAAIVLRKTATTRLASALTAS